MNSRKIIFVLSVIALGFAVQGEAAQGISQRDAPPKIEALPLQPYVAVRMEASIEQLNKVIPAGIGQVAGLLGAHGIQPAGPPFVRYLVVDMPKHLEIQIGFPVGKPVKAVAPLLAGAFPAGRYITYTYTGPYSGLIGANGTVINWASKHRLSLDQKPAKQGVAWGARAEIYITDPSHEPDPNKLKTKIMCRLVG